jgi:hypothetical protein
MLKSVVKSPGSTGSGQWILGVWSGAGGIGIPGVAVKCVDIGRNADGESGYLGLY